jgi:hypothetical protein
MMQAELWPVTKLAVVPLVGALFAAATATSDINLGALAQFGVLGVVLAWFMFRLEKILQQHTKVIERQTRTLAIVLQAIADNPQVAREVGVKARKALEEAGVVHLEGAE